MELLFDHSTKSLTEILREVAASAHRHRRAPSNLDPLLGPEIPRFPQIDIEQMATVGYKELNESGGFVIPGFVKMSVVNKLAAEAGSGVNPFKEAMEFVAKLARKSIKASRLKVAKDTV